MSDNVPADRESDEVSGEDPCHLYQQRCRIGCGEFGKFLRTQILGAVAEEIRDQKDPGYDEDHQYAGHPSDDRDGRTPGGIVRAVRLDRGRWLGKREGRVIFFLLDVVHWAEFSE